MAEMVEQKIASGEYASESEVLCEGLRTLQDRDAAIERWLREEVVPTAKAHEADPSRAIPIDEVFDRIIGRLRTKEPSKA